MSNMPGYETLPDPMVQLTAADKARRGSWMQTYTGVSFYPLDPRASEVRVEDVAHGLAMSCRYGGQARRFYSVAEHCVLVSMFVPPEYRREALLHDASEAYIGDMIRPLKHTPEMHEFRKAEDAIQAAVFEAFGIVSTPESHRAVKLVDDRILLDEIRQLMPRPEMYIERMAKIEPLAIDIPCMPPNTAERAFLDAFAELFPEYPFTLPRW